MSATMSRSGSMPARLCIRTAAAPVSAIVSAMAGSFCNPQTSLTTLAPSSVARRATLALDVSIEIGTSMRLASLPRMGSRRASSSSAATGVCPGRVDSAPTSIMSAPSAASFSDCCMAASRLKNLPPSEKESGVMFNMPMMTGLVPMRPRNRSRRSIMARRSICGMEARLPSTIGSTILDRERMNDVVVPKVPRLNQSAATGAAILRGEENFSLSESRHVSGETDERAGEKPRGGAAFGSQQVRNKAGEPQIVHTAIDESRRQFGRVCKHDRAPPHEVTGQAAAFPEHDQRSGDDPAAGIIPSGAFDHNGATAQAVARARAGISAHDQQAAGHALHFAFERRAEKASGIARDLDPASGHGGARERPAIAHRDEIAAAHVAAKRFAAIAFDDDFSSPHVHADIVKACRTSLEPDCLHAA